MTCPFTHDDAAYVLGALSPAHRLDFEKHLPGCDDCTRSVRELAGLPGLLGRVEASALDQPPVVEPVPSTLLPALSRDVRRARRRRTLATAALAAAVAAAIVMVVVTQVGDDAGSAPTVAGPSSAPPGVVPLTMEPIGNVPVEATVSLEQVTWGTRLGFTCTYDTNSVAYQLPPAADYTLFVLTRNGHREQVGSWRSVDGKTMQLSAGTAASRQAIAAVEVRTPDGRVLLQLDA